MHNYDETSKYSTKNHYLGVNEYAKFIGGDPVFVQSTVLVI